MVPVPSEYEYELINEYEFLFMNTSTYELLCRMPSFAMYLTSN